jgi:hypothetical protein
MRFNLKAIGKTRKTVNHEGEKAYALPAQLELYSLVATSMLSDQFYESADDKLNRLRKLIAANDAAFVARLAIYTREQLHMRTLPLILTVELAKIHEGDGLIGRLTGRVVQRADEITELLAYYVLANDRKKTKKLGGLSKQIQKGLAVAFNKFDEYQFAKYNRDTQVTLKDALFLVHPKAKDAARQALFDKIVKGELQTPFTWEVELSRLGQQTFASEKQKKAAVQAKWEELIQSNKLGYMATLRNLRNMLEANVDAAALNKVCQYLSNPVAVAGSKQLPFRFLSAYRELKDTGHGQTGKILDALEDAVMHSAANIAGYDANTKVVIAADVSGSMQKAITAKSKIQNYDIGLMLAMLLQTRCKDVVTGMFGDTWKRISVPKKNVLANVQEFHRREGEVGYATNGYKVIEDLLRRKEVVDKIMLFTDCQLWNSAGTGVSFPGLWKQYRDLAPRAKLYLFDLAGYGNTPVDVLRDDVYLIAGWSDKIFDVLKALDEGRDAVKMINQIDISHN